MGRHLKVIHNAPESVLIEKNVRDAYDDSQQLECDVDGESSIIVLSEQQFSTRFPHFSEPTKRDADASLDSDSYYRSNSGSEDNS